MQQELPGIVEQWSEWDSTFNFEYPNAEIVIGLVYAVGTDYAPVLSFLKDQIGLSAYRVNEIHLSRWFEEISENLGLSLNIVKSPEFERITSLMEAGNRIREKSRRADVLALDAAGEKRQGVLESFAGDSTPSRKVAGVEDRRGRESESQSKPNVS